MNKINTRGLILNQKEAIRLDLFLSEMNNKEEFKPISERGLYKLMKTLNYSNLTRALVLRWYFDNNKIKKEV